jgi:L-cysteine/cystine lyase
VAVDAPSAPHEKLAAVRREFPVLARQAYLNTGTAGPLPRRAAEAMREQVERELEAGRASLRANVERYFPLREELRARFARLLHASPAEVAITHHATEGMHLATWGLRWRPGDEIVTTTHEHEGGLLPVYAAARHLGLAVRVADVGVDAGRALDAIAAALTPRTRLVAFSHVSYRTGTILPVAEIAAAAHRAGAFVAVDGAQAAGAVDVDAGALGADAYAVSGQKWLCGPEGVGALYVRRDRISELSPTFAGHFSLRDPGAIDLAGAYLPAATARRYDGGTAHWPALFGMRESLRHLEEDVGHGWIRERCLAMTERARELLAGVPGARVLSPPGSVALTAFEVAGLRPAAAAGELEKRGVVLRSLAHPDCLRISTGFFNGDDDLDRLVEELEALR